MSEIYCQRRYLTEFDSRRTGNILSDVVVIGSGVAGMRAALAAAEHVRDVLLICKQTLFDSATHDAQGGVAAAVGPGDSVAKHVEDTIRVGCGLCREEAVQVVVGEGPARMRELIDWGGRFEGADGVLDLGMEGGHSVPRIVHHSGAETGREITRVLAERVRANDRIRVFECCFVVDLLTDGTRCLGATTNHRKYGHQIVWASRTILAAGGCGRLFRETTNPTVATGDGYAIGYRAGAALADLEFVQFHPTTLYVAGATRSLISEAVRGAGARLINKHGERFMGDYHPDGELAPRDVVSRAIVDQIRKTRSASVFLDVRHFPPGEFRRRFPRISERCAAFQIDVEKDPIPVRPAAHYMIGGVVTDLEGRTTIDGLFCCGEVACTGLHGANRLASNSLLEGLVFGATVGDRAGAEAAAGPAVQPQWVTSNKNHSERSELDLPDILHSLRSLMWRNVGIERASERLADAADIIVFWGKYVLDKTFDEPSGWEVQNMLTLARLIVAGAIGRRRSVGVHFRTQDDGAKADERGHLSMQRTERGDVVRWTDLDFKPLADGAGGA